MPDSLPKQKMRGASTKEVPAPRETRSSKLETTAKVRGGRRAPSPIPNPPTGTRGRKARRLSPVSDPPQNRPRKKAVPQMTSTPHKKVEATIRDEEDEEDEDEDEGEDGGKEAGEDDVVIRYQSPSSIPDDKDDKGEGDNEGEDGKDEEEEEEEGAMDVYGDNSVAAAEVEAAAVAAEIERGRAEEAQFLDGVDEWEDVEDDDGGEIAEGEGLAEMRERVLTVATDKLNAEQG
ncbi:hypothetical protein DFH09DRAFT_1480973 [Mycena vulgaris]|nr:hypothetical protein DFH09DRAFT_1480973 [Mycena vulgaris]